MLLSILFRFIVQLSLESDVLDEEEGEEAPFPWSGDLSEPPALVLGELLPGAAEPRVPLPWDPSVSTQGTLGWLGGPSAYPGLAWFFGKAHPRAGGHWGIL